MSISVTNHLSNDGQNWKKIEQGSFFYSTLSEKLEAKSGLLYAWHKVRKWLGDWGIMAQVDRSAKWKACASAVQFKLGQLEEGAKTPEKVGQVAGEVLRRLPQDDLLSFLAFWSANSRLRASQLDTGSSNYPGLSDVCNQLLRIKAGDKQTIDEIDRGAASPAELRLMALLSEYILGGVDDLLHAAIESGCRELALHLIHEGKVDLNNQSAWGWTPLDHAVFGDDLEMVEELARAGARTRSKQAGVECIPGQLHQLIIDGDQSEACRLIASLFAQSSSKLQSFVDLHLDQGAIRKSLVIGGESIDRPNLLELAVCLNRRHVVNILVKAGAASNCRSEFVQCMLISHCIDHGFEEGAIRMIERGHFQEEWSQKEWLLPVMNRVARRNSYCREQMSRESCNRICKAFIDKGIGLDELGRYQLQTPLQEAIQEENAEIALYLIEKGVDLALQDGEQGRTAAHFAVQARDYQVLSKLVEMGIDLDIKDNDGDTAMDLAKRLADRDALLIMGSGDNIKG